MTNLLMKINEWISCAIEDSSCTSGSFEYSVSFCSCKQIQVNKEFSVYFNNGLWFPSLFFCPDFKTTSHTLSPHYLYSTPSWRSHEHRSGIVFINSRSLNSVFVSFYNSLSQMNVHRGKPCASHANTDMRVKETDTRNREWYRNNA